ncbi:MAG: phosphoglucosamine mutase [Thermoplasmata archaeon]|nr:phosphoglucosamine mutase [Thermoplasmata archaeon]
MADEPPRLFGTDGIRRVVGTEFTPELVSQAASALATCLGNRGPVPIASDFRTTSDGMARLLAGSLQMRGVDVLEMGKMPTPALQYNVRALGAPGGLMVTASHNPTEFNGIKFCGAGGLEIPRSMEQAIERCIHERRFVTVPWNEVGTIRQDSQGVDRYLSSIEKNVDVESIRAARLRVILDCGNGTSAVTSPRLLRSLGCRLTTLNANPDGYFPGHPSEPTDENLADLKAMVIASGADFGVAHDGDSDRVAFVDERGRYVPGEVTLALFAREELRAHPKGLVVTSITSSTCVEKVVAHEGGEIVITRSGSLPVAEEIDRRHALFGGEENGGYYWPNHQTARDGPMSSAKMLEVLVRRAQPLSELIAELPRSVVVKAKTPLAPELRATVVGRVTTTLTGEARRVVTLDGVKAFYDDGWLLIRPSGTEPICRVFAESDAPDRARALVDHGLSLVRTAAER